MGDGVGEVAYLSALDLAEVDVVDGGEPAQQLTGRTLERAGLDAVTDRPACRARGR